MTDPRQADRGSLTAMTQRPSVLTHAEMSSRGGFARAKRLSAARKREIAAMGARAMMAKRAAKGRKKKAA